MESKKLTQARQISMILTMAALVVDDDADDDQIERSKYPAFPLLESARLTTLARSCESHRSRAQSSNSKMKPTLDLAFQFFRAQSKIQFQF